MTRATRLHAEITLNSGPDTDPRLNHTRITTEGYSTADGLLIDAAFEVFLRGFLRIIGDLHSSPLTIDKKPDPGDTPVPPTHKTAGNA